MLFAALLVSCPEPSRSTDSRHPPAVASSEKATEVGGNDPSAPVARIDGQTITWGELLAEAKAPLSAADAKHAEEVQGIKSRVLDALIDRRLLESKAKKDGIAVEALIEREVTRKIPEPEEEYLQSVYDATKATGRVLPPFPKVKDEIARYVKGQDFQHVRDAYLARLRSEAKVESLLPPLLPPKVDVEASGPSRGDASAPVTIVEFSDYECEFCGAAEPVVSRVMQEYQGKVRLVFQSFPLSIHRFSNKASEAALCAGEQGKYWDMHGLLFSNQKALKPEDLAGYGKAIGLEWAAYSTCLDSGRMAASIEESRKAGERAGVTATPTFFINGRPISGSQSFERFKEIIDYELAHP